MYCRKLPQMKVHLINPSHSSFGTAVITPRWMYVIAAATPAFFGDPILVDETLEHVNPEHIQPGDVVGISIHTENALRGYEIGKIRVIAAGLSSSAVSTPRSIQKKHVASAART